MLQKALNSSLRFVGPFFDKESGLFKKKVYSAGLPQFSLTC